MSVWKDEILFLLKTKTRGVQLSFQRLKMLLRPKNQLFIAYGMVVRKESL
jgi:hypothetical protein